MKLLFDSKELDRDLFENADKTHFILNMDFGRTLGLVGSGEVKYAELVSFGEPISIIVRIT